jgi:hypothetical protein
MARQKGIITHIETKNRVIRVRLTARQYAETKQIANATNHKLAEVLRKSLEDFLTKNKDLIIKCRSSNYLSKPLKSYNNNNNNKGISLKDKLTYKESISSDIPSDSYLSFLEEECLKGLRRDRELARLKEYVARADADVLTRELYRLQIRDLEKELKT